MKLAIGRFDGMHFAHQQLFNISDEILVIEKNSYLTPKTTRCEYTSLKCNFYKLENIKHLSPYQFIQKIKKEFNPSEIIVGYDFRFGKDRQGSLEDLQKYFKVQIINEIKIDNIGVHSRIIKNFIKEGNIKQANKFLNHTYKIKALQIKGQGIGKKQLLPTINLNPIYNYIIPKNGVYLTLLNKQPSITFIGIRSTDNQFSIETHIINQNISNEIYELEFIEFLRENQHFIDISELKQAIIADKEKAKQFFKGYL